MTLHLTLINNLIKVTTLTLFDLPAAFGTIDHKTLIECLYILYGILGTNITWFSL